MEMENAESAIGNAMVKDTFGARPYRKTSDEQGNPVTPPSEGEPGAVENVATSIGDLLFGDAVIRNGESARREDGE